MKRNRLFILFFIILILICTTTSLAGSETNKGLSSLNNTIAYYGGILTAFALSTGVLVMIIHFIRLANSYDHPIMRRQVQKDIVISGVTIALIGGIGLIGRIIAASVLYTP